MSPRVRRFPPDVTLGEWHRWTLDDDARALDLDLVGQCVRCGAPLYVIEGTQDFNQYKPTSFIQRIATQLNCTGWLVMYTKAELCRCSDVGAPYVGCQHGIATMRVRRVYPAPTGLRSVAPGVFAAILATIRENHMASVCARPDALGLMQEEIA